MSIASPAFQAILYIVYWFWLAFFFTLTVTCACLSQHANLVRAQVSVQLDKPCSVLYRFYWRQVEAGRSKSKCGVSASTEFSRSCFRNSSFHLHNTSRLALALTIASNPLSAEHQYFPDWFLFVLKLSVSPDPTVFPFTLHVIFGIGLPVAVQWNDAVAPSMMVWSTGVVTKLDETAIERIVGSFISQG